MIPARDAQVDVDGQLQPLLDQSDISAAWWRQNAASEDPEVIEMVVPVKWLATRPVEKAFSEKELFTPRQTFCKLRDTPTIETVESAFGLNEATK